MTEAAESVRIDVWLWRARFFKTRAMAARAIADGAARIMRGGESRTLEKASATVRPGDGLTVMLGGRFRSVRVLALGARRGPASEARQLYADPDDALDASGQDSQTVTKSGGDPNT
jgi:ribosome-associated heat shock protein Hsp15